MLKTHTGWMRKLFVSSHCELVRMVWNPDSEWQLRFSSSSITSDLIVSAPGFSLVPLVTGIFKVTHTSGQVELQLPVPQWFSVTHAPHWLSWYRQQPITALSDTSQTSTRRFIYLLLNLIFPYLIRKFSSCSLSSTTLESLIESLEWWTWVLSLTSFSESESGSGS